MFKRFSVSFHKKFTMILIMILTQFLELLLWQILEWFLRQYLDLLFIFPKRSGTGGIFLCVWKHWWHYRGIFSERIQFSLFIFAFRFQHCYIFSKLFIFPFQRLWKKKQIIMQRINGNKIFIKIIAILRSQRIEQTRKHLLGCWSQAQINGERWR